MRTKNVYLNKRNKYFVFAGVALAGDRQAVSVVKLSVNNRSGKENTARLKGDYIL